MNRLGFNASVAAPPLWAATGRVVQTLQIAIRRFDSGPRLFVLQRVTQRQQPASIAVTGPLFDEVFDRLGLHGLV